MSAFQKEIEQVINRHSEENASGTPDFVLAKFLLDCLTAFNSATTSRANWRNETIDKII